MIFLDKLLSRIVVEVLETRCWLTNHVTNEHDFLLLFLLGDICFVCRIKSATCMPGTHYSLLLIFFFFFRKNKTFQTFLQ